MGVRLIAMRRVLRDDGSIYLHCDPTASHYLKQLLDAIFGRQHFLGEIQWNKQNGVKTKNRWGNENESILCFAKKISRHTLNITDPACRKPFSDLSLSMHFKKRDESGRRFRERTIRGKTYRYYADEGRFIGNLWNDISSMQANTPLKSEATGYPTQKPLALYERIIRASSSEDDWVLDPFAGCATTCVAAERMGRQWVGIDLWDGTHQIILDRLQAEGLAGPDGATDRLFTFGDITYTDQPPERTDQGEAAVPFLQVTERYAEPASPVMSRAAMLEHLLAQHGAKCQGCDRVFDDQRYLELDHNTPRSDGGLNHITNRVLLCGPCNRVKSNTYTLSGLRRENGKRGYMAKGRQ